MPTENDELKIWVDFVKWFGGTLVLSGFASWSNHEYQQRQLDQAAAQLAHDIAIETLEQEQSFFEVFLEEAINEDIQVRIRLAHYIKSTATNPDIRLAWAGFYEDLVAQCGQDESSCRVGGVETLN